jgi:hypothetical protein
MAFVHVFPEFRKMPRTDRYRRYLEKANLSFLLDEPATASASSGAKS